MLVPPLRKASLAQGLMVFHEDEWILGDPVSSHVSLLHLYILILVASIQAYIGCDHVATK